VREWLQPRVRLYVCVCHFVLFLCVSLCVFAGYRGGPSGRSQQQQQLQNQQPQYQQPQIGYGASSRAPSQQQSQRQQRYR